jgi:hypothetical protein
VNRAGDHFELRYGKSDDFDRSWEESLPVALIGPVVRRTFPVEFLPGKGGQSLPPDIVAEVIVELEFILVGGERNPA